MNKKLLAICLAVVLLVGGAYIGSPFWAVHQFRDAAISADIDRLDGAVDFPAVRESLKSQMTVAITAKMENDPEMASNPFAGLGMMLIPSMVGKMVDTVVTPEGMSALMKRGRMEHGVSTPQANSDVKYEYDYRGIDRFAVTVLAPDTEKDETPRFVFERRGLFSWKLIRLEIPQSVFADKE